MSNSIKNLSVEIKSLLKEIDTSGTTPVVASSQFAQHAKSQLKRAMRDKSLAEDVKRMLNDILDAYQKSGMDGLDSFSKEGYRLDSSFISYMLNKARSDAKNGVELPSTVDNIFNDLSREKENLINKEKEKREALKKSEEDRLARLSPAEREAEENKKKADAEYQHLMAIYGGEENYRSGRGLGT